MKPIKDSQIKIIIEECEFNNEWIVHIQIGEKFKNIRSELSDTLLLKTMQTIYDLTKPKEECNNAKI